MASTEQLPPFEAYKGTEPYIFVSYAHEDSALIFPELVWLARMGINIWYDEGIDPGNEWPDEIAMALDNASLFLYYVSPNSAQSINCRNEVNYALNHQKEFVAIYLEETDLPKGLNLRIGSLQAILKHRMTHESYERKIRKTLESFVKSALGDSSGVKIALVDSGIEITHPKPSPQSESREKGEAEATRLADEKRRADEEAKAAKEKRKAALIRFWVVVIIILVLLFVTLYLLGVGGEVRTE